MTTYIKSLWRWLTGNNTQIESNDEDNILVESSNLENPSQQNSQNTFQQNYDSDYDEDAEHIVNHKISKNEKKKMKYDKKKKDEYKQTHNRK